ncbi:hypothetical protein CLD22_27980, partial [Rubrivivax gelatinosus]|nr:hypothetical protein [Rubrivivax gelatinosus]
LISSAFAIAGPAHAGLILDLDGAGGVPAVEVTALDWSQTSFLAQGANAAIAAFAGGATGSSTQFQVYTHAKLTGYTLANGGTSTSLPSAFTDKAEITMVAGYTEKVTSVNATATMATFATTGAGWLEIYYDTTPDADDLTGSGFNDGLLIAKLTGVGIDSTGLFMITSSTQIALDQSSDGNDYDGQLTISGIGSQESVKAGTGDIELDGDFFKSTLEGFVIDYENISIGLPFRGANPSDCFNTTTNAGAIGSSNNSTCDTTHVDGLYSANGGSGGYTPVVGGTNGGSGPIEGPDFVAQTDFNSAVNGVPEPGTLALVGL